MMVAMNRDLNMKRRFLLQPEINPSYRHLCAPSVPITTHLFGDDVQDRIKQHGEANRAFNQFLSTQGRGWGSVFRGGHVPTMTHTAPLVGQESWMRGWGAYLEYIDQL